MKSHIFTNLASASVLIATMFLSGCIVIPIGAIETAATRPTGGAPGFENCSAPDGPKGITERISALSNAQRKAKGLAPLQTGAAQELAAQQHACDLARRGRPPADLARPDQWDPHKSNNGAALRHRTDDAGIGKCRVKENLAAGQSSAEQIMADWLRSPTHRDPIFDRSMRKQGIGMSTDANGNLWVVAVYSGNC